MGFLAYPFLSYWDGSQWITVGELGWYDYSSVIMQRMFIRGRGGGWPAETALIVARHYDGSWLLLTFDFNKDGYTDSAGRLWEPYDIDGGGGDLGVFAQDAAGDVWAGGQGPAAVGMQNRQA